MHRQRHQLLHPDKQGTAPAPAHRAPAAWLVRAIPLAMLDTTAAHPSRRCPGKPRVAVAALVGPTGSPRNHLSSAVRLEMTVRPASSPPVAVSLLALVPAR